MVLPILIVPSLAPGLYFFCAAAGAASARAATKAAADIMLMGDIVSSLSSPLPSAADHVAHQLPALAVELLELHLLDREEIGRAGIDLDARQQHRHFEVLEVGRLLHDVLARQIVAALLQHLGQRVG